jgi:hypothetical protein
MPPPSIIWLRRPVADYLGPLGARWGRVKFPSMKTASTQTR